MNSDKTDWLLCREERRDDALTRLKRERPMKDKPFSFWRRTDEFGRKIQWRLRQGRWCYDVAFDLKGAGFLYGGIEGLRHEAARMLLIGRRELREHVNRQEGVRQ